MMLLRYIQIFHWSFLKYSKYLYWIFPEIPPCFCKNHEKNYNVEPNGGLFELNFVWPTEQIKSPGLSTGKPVVFTDNMTSHQAFPITRWGKHQEHASYVFQINVTFSFAFGQCYACKLSKSQINDVGNLCLSLDLALLRNKANLKLSCYWIQVCYKKLK